jgi:hypothetical protein
MNFAMQNEIFRMANARQKRSAVGGLVSRGLEDAAASYASRGRSYPWPRPKHRVTVRAAAAIAVSMPSLRKARRDS